MREDLRLALRVLRKHPGYAALVIVIMGLGIGANTAIFSVLNAVVLRPFPYAAPERLYELGASRKGRSLSLSAADFVAWQARTQVFEGMAAARRQDFTLTGADEPEHVYGLRVTRECLPMLGTPPILGRWLSQEDYRPGAPPVVLLAHRLWSRRFGADPQIAGKQVLLPSFRFNARNHEVWMPLVFTADQLNRLDPTGFMACGRLKPGLTRRQAEAEADVVSRILAEDLPQTHAGWQATLTPLVEEAVAEFRPALLALLGAVGLVLLIACLNAANLLLARASERAREMAVRIALGAGRWRLMRALLTESVLLALLGGVLGLLLAAWGVRALAALYPERIPVPRLDQSGIDAYVLGFTLLVSAASGIVFGLAPAWQALRTDLNEALKESGRSTSGGLGALRFRNLLVAAEVALSLVLLAGAGLMLRSFLRLLQVHPGFRAQKVLTVRLPLPAYRIPDRKQQPAYYTGILRHVQALPGVQAAGLVTMLPLSGGEALITFAKSQAAALRGEVSLVVAFRAVSPDYFRALGIPLLLGRSFTDADTVGAPRVAIVNQALARRCWPGENPLGKSLPVGEPLLVVGVVGNVKHIRLSAEPDPELYLPYLQYLGVPHSTLVIRTSAEPLKLAATVRRGIRQLHADQPITDVKTMEEVVVGSLATPRFYTLLLGIFAGLALALAAAGVYGVMSYSVSRRTQEIGIRMALGAQPGAVLRLMFWQGGKWILFGVAAGVLGAVATTRLIAKLLYGVSPTDTATLILVSLLLVAVALAASYLPARRAARVEPVAALRHE
jgi:putative ABC transport system permease protein